MYNEQIWTLPVLTHVVDDEAFTLAENEPGRVRVEGDSQIGRGGEELERAAAANVPPQYASGELLAICDGYHVAVADVESGQKVQCMAFYDECIHEGWVKMEPLRLKSKITAWVLPNIPFVIFSDMTYQTATNNNHSPETLGISGYVITHTHSVACFIQITAGTS